MSSDCSSIPDAKFFNEKYVYPIWFTRKKMVFHNKMLKRLKKLRFMHSRASQYYESMNIKLSAPSIIITALSGIASFLSTSQYVDEDSQNACGITVGVLASVASVFQAFTAACQYGAKREAHRTVAEQYNALIVKTKFEMEMPNEEDFIDNLEKAILEIDAKCNYFVPQFIISEWDKEEKKNNDLKSIEKINNLENGYSSDNNLNIGIFEEQNNENETKNSNTELDVPKRDNVNLEITDNLNIPESNDLDVQTDTKKDNAVDEETYLLESAINEIAVNDISVEIPSVKSGSNTFV